MKRNVKRVSAVMMAAMVALSGQTVSLADEGSQERIFDKYIQDEEPVDLNGYEFKIIDFNTDIWGPEEVESVRDQLSMDIVEDVENTFNCVIEVEDVSPDVIFETMQPAVMSGDKYADLVGTTMWAFGNLLGGGLTADLTKIETLDLSAEGFNQELNKVATFGNSTYGFGASFGSHMTSQAAVLYNASIWDELGLPDPYELVRNNEWTWDKLLEYAKLALRDNDGNGIIDSESDRWGITGPSGDFVRTMYLSMGGTYYAPDSEGKMRVSCLDSESAEKMNFMYKFFQNDKVLYRNGNEGAFELFVAGKSLFTSHNNDIANQMKEMEDDFGLLPCPKWNSEQEEYLNPVDHNAKIYSIPTSNKNTYEAGIIISALARRYQAYDELMIEEMEDTYWRFDEDAEMARDYIVGHGCYDIINIIKNANSNFELPNSVLFGAVYDNSYSDITSTIASYEEPLNILLDELFGNLSK